MKRIPEAYRSKNVEYTSREIALCGCGGILSFDVNLNGYVIESCVRCHKSQPMTRAPRRSEIEKVTTRKSALVIEIIECQDCPSRFNYEHGRGTRPKRCPDCRELKAKADARDYARRRSEERARRRAA